MNYMKTAILLAGMTALFMAIGAMVGGQMGAVIAFLIAAGMNVWSYWFSDRAVLSMYGAEEIDPNSGHELYQMTAEMAQRAGIPMPKLYVIHDDQPNAFATGRNPQNAAVAVNTGLLNMLTREEVAGVIAHELAHIKNRDTLIMTVTATIAGAISMLANFAAFARPDNRSSPLGPIVGILIMILAPIAAMVVQMMISRVREYAADRAGGEICGNPVWLASALAKISGGAAAIPNWQAERNPATAHMFIVNPLSGARADNLFSTHPNAQNRIDALMEQAAALGVGYQQQPAYGQPYQQNPWG